MSYDKNNIFAKILRGEVPCNKVFENEYAFAFYDIAPVAPVHVLVLPKGEFRNFEEFTRKAAPEFIAGYFTSIRTIAVQLSVQDAFRMITNVGENAGQSVFHFHCHIIAGKPLGGLIP